MKQFRTYFVIILTLILFGYQGQVLAQEISDETIPLPIVPAFVETDEFEAVAGKDSLLLLETVADDISDDSLPSVSDSSSASDIPSVHEEEGVEDLADLPDIDLSNLDRLYSSMTDMEEDIAAKSAEDESSSRSMWRQISSQKP